MVGVGERVIKTRTAAFVGCGVGGARDLPTLVARIFLFGQIWFRPN